MYTSTVVAEGVLLSVSMAMRISSGCTAVPYWQRVYCWLYLWQWGSVLGVQRYRGGGGCIVGCIYGNEDLFWMYSGTVVAEGVLLAVSMAMGISSGCTAVPWWQRVYCWLYLWQCGSLVDIQRYRGGRGCIVGCIYGNGDLFWMYSGTVVAEGVLLAVFMAMGISSGCTAVLWWQRVYCWLYPWQWGSLFGCTVVPWWWRVYCWLYLWQWGFLLNVKQYRGGGACIVGCVYGNGDLFWMYSGTVVADGLLLAVSMTMGISSGCTPVPWWRRVYCWLYL